MRWDAIEAICRQPSAVSYLPSAVSYLPSAVCNEPTRQAREHPFDIDDFRFQLPVKVAADQA